MALFDVKTNSYREARYQSVDDLSFRYKLPLNFYDWKYVLVI